VTHCILFPLSPTQNNPDEALSCALAAIRAKPTWGKGFLREASALGALGHVSEAVSSSMAALELACSDGERRAFAKALTGSLQALAKSETKAETETTTGECPTGDGQRQAQRLHIIVQELMRRQQHQQSMHPFLVVYGGRGGQSGAVLDDLAILDLETKRWLGSVQVR
jgi:hypothetical protein